MTATKKFRGSGRWRSCKNFFSDEVFVFTPGKDLVVLPRGSNPIDFAYRIHTEVGHHCVGAKVNGRIVPLEYKLQNGDFVEVVTNKSNNGPSRDWLNIVASSDTRTKIRAWFKRENREENIVHGLEQLETELKKLGYAPKDLLKKNWMEQIAKRMSIPTVDDLLAFTKKIWLNTCRPKFPRCLPK